MAKYLKITILFLAILLQSCASGLFVKKEIFPHAMLLDRDGSSFDVESDALSGTYNMDQHIDSITTGIEQSEQKDIMIYIHGGMKPIEESLAETEEQIPLINQEGEYYPIYINWESGFLSCYTEQLLFIRNGTYQPVFGPLTAPFYFLADVGGAIFRLPLNLCKQANDELSHASFSAYNIQNKPYLHYDQSMNLYKNTESYTNSNPMPSFISYLSNGLNKLTSTIMLDVFGRKALKNMTRRTEQLFHQEEQLHVESIGNGISEVVAPKGGVAQLMDSLSQMTKTDSNFTLTLIGHSMGTMVINDIIRNYGDLPIKEIIYMGAACSLREFEEVILPYLKRPDRLETRFYNLCLHPDMEFGEKMMGEMVPKGSLLEWLDNYLNDPDDLMDMTAGRIENIVNINNLIPKDLEQRVVIKVFGPGRNKPTMHGEFNDTNVTFWNKKFWNGERANDNGSEISGL